MSEIDRLAGLLVPPLGEDFRRAQARILQWDPDTYENVIDYEGQRLVNVPVGPSAQVAAMTYQEGDIVLLEGWFPGGRRGELGLGSYWIAGKVTIPGTGAAERSIAWMQTALAARLARTIFAESIHEDSVFPEISIPDQNTGNTFIDLPGSPGPTVPGVEIGPSGRALVLVTALLTVETHTTDAQIVRATMSYETTGATVTPPDLVTRHLELMEVHQTIGDDDNRLISLRASRASFASGLNPGQHTFRAKYTALVAGTGNRARFADRTLTVIPF